MTWNIHGAVGLDGCYNLDRILAVIRRHDPDILCLQEVETGGGPAGHRSFDQLVGALGGEVAEAWTVRSPDRTFGHMLLSRWPLSGNQLHDLTVRRREPRAAIEAVVQSPFGDIHVISVHFGLDIRERRRQAVLLKALGQAAKHDVAVALGDFNDWVWPAPVERTLRAVYPVCVSPRTYPARMPVFRLDRLYCRPGPVFGKAFVDRNTELASDHLPLVADIDPSAVAN